MAINSFQIQDKVFLSLLGLTPQLPQLKKDIFSNASKISDLKRIDNAERKQIREEIELLSNSMKNKSKSMSNFLQKKPLTPFNQFELLKDENKRVIKRKASFFQTNNLAKTKTDNYLLKIKKIKISKRNPQFLNISLLHVNYFNQPLTSNHLYLKGKKIDFNQNNAIDSFLTSKITFNSKQINHSTVVFKKQTK